MKIGVCVPLDGRDRLRRRLELLKQEGFDNGQLISWNPADWSSENARAIRQLAQENGFLFSAFWCGWEGPCVWNFYEGPATIGLVPPAFREKRIQNLCDGADFARTIGIADVITHMGFIPEDPHDPQFLPFCDAVKRVAAHVKQNGQYLLFETGQETPVTLLRCLETVGAENLGVNLDTANLILYGKANPADALDVLGPYVRGVHAKDGLYPTNGHDLGQEVRIGDGKVAFETLFRKLKDCGYDGYVTIEREIGGEQQLRDIRRSRQYLEDLNARIYRG